MYSVILILYMSLESLLVGDLILENSENFPEIELASLAPDGYAVTSIDAEAVIRYADSVINSASVPGKEIWNGDPDTLIDYKYLVINDSRMMLASSDLLADAAGDGKFISVNVSILVNELRDLEEQLRQNIELLKNDNIDTALEVDEAVKQTRAIQTQMAIKAAEIKSELERISARDV